MASIAHDILNAPKGLDMSDNAGPNARDVESAIRNMSEINSLLFKIKAAGAGAYLKSENYTGTLAAYEALVNTAVSACSTAFATLAALRPDL